MEFLGYDRSGFMGTRFLMSSSKTAVILSSASGPWRSQRPRVRLIREKASPRLMR
jgi:hypothetical protein